MRINIEPTSQIVEINGDVQARLWEGMTDSGVPCYLLVSRIAVHNDDDSAEFDRILAEQRAPSMMALQAFPLRMVL